MDKQSEEKKSNKSVNEKWLYDLKNLVRIYDIEPDVVDWASLDWSLSYQELKNIVFSTWCSNSKHAMEEHYKMIDEAEIKEIEGHNWHKRIMKADVLSKVNTIAVYGGLGSGKTALCFKILEVMKTTGKQVYFIKHPNPMLLREFGYKNLDSIERLEGLQDCIVYYDEPQLSTSMYDHHTNGIIAKICSLARQRGITLIISTSDTRVFTKHNESYFDLWLIKDIDFEMCKQGSKIKNIIKKHSTFDANGFKLNVNEFLADSRTLTDGIESLNGKYVFDVPKGWNDKLSRPYRINSQQNSE